MTKRGKVSLSRKKGAKKTSMMKRAKRKVKKALSSII
jgi:hypothetical protein